MPTSSILSLTFFLFGLYMLRQVTEHAEWLPCPKNTHRTKKCYSFHRMSMPPLVMFHIVPICHI